jgi:predicted Rossmann fold flavoprotein
MQEKQIVDVIVLGAGAAGLMCAIEAGRRGRSVLLIDHAEKVGKKILISGGGRCNFTNLDCRPENFLSENPHFAKSALARYTSADFIEMVQEHGIAFHEKTLGQLFCDRSAHDIVTMLEKECVQANVQTILGATVVRVTRETDFRIETSAGIFHAMSLVVATGGLSIPKMGATGFGYTVAEDFGLRIIPCRPALVPLVFSTDDSNDWCDLAGLSAEVVATASTRTPSKGRSTIPSFREKLLITHRGVSGPAILQASSYWHPGTSIQFDLAPGVDVTEELLVHNSRRDRGAAFMALRNIFSGRLAERWLDVYPPQDWTNAGIAAFEHQLHTWTVTPAGTEGYAKAEVTVGGVDTAELDAKTMQSKKVPGLYFIGEVVDVTGWLGGYNFQWAWASGASAGRSV